MNPALTVRNVEKTHKNRVNYEKNIAYSNK